MDELAWILPTAITAGVLLVILLLVGWQFVREKNFQNGLYLWQRRSLYARGAVATGEVMNVVEAGTVRGGGTTHASAFLTELVVDVRPETGAPWRASMHYLFTSMERRLVERGCVVPLRYDAANPKRLVIDWPTLEGAQAREANAVKEAAKEAALAERRALLAQERPAAGPVKPGRP